MYYTIGIDVGSSGVKTILCDEQGNVLATQSEKYTVSYPKVGWAEQDSRLWVNALIKTIPILIAKANVNVKNIVAICLSSQIDGIVPVDKNGNPLHNAIIWVDRRATKEADVIKDKIGEEKIYKITGMKVDPSHPAAKILWFRENCRKVYDNTWKFLLPNDFMIYHLTGETVTDYSNASCTMLFDIVKKNWDYEICNELYIDIDKLPRVQSSIDIAGYLKDNIAEKLGLPRRLPVITGGGDEEVGAVGGGAIEEGVVLDIIGTAEPVVMTVNKPKWDPLMILECHCHAHPEKWILENPGILSGGIYSWFLKNFFEYEKRKDSTEGNMDPYELMNKEAENVNVGCNGLMCFPYFSGSITPEWNPYVKGVFIGIAPIHKRGHFIRSIIEGTGYVVKDTIERFTALDFSPHLLIIAGGGSKGKIWRNVRTNITGLTTKVPLVEDVTAYGASLLALVGAGIYEKIEDLLKLIKYKDEIKPKADIHKKYLELYGVYLDCYKFIKEIYKKWG